MIKSITIQNFFSFGRLEQIEINNQINILIGINGSGKSNFIKAIQLLYESVVGDGMEKLFSANWGGFSGVSNFTEDLNEIVIVYEFDKLHIAKAVNQEGFKFLSNPYYEIKLSKVGNGYRLSEWFYNLNPGRPVPFTYLKVEMVMRLFQREL